MAKSYFSRILSKTVAPTFRVVDTLGVTASPAVAAYFYFTGRRMPESISEAIGAWVLGGALAFLVVRLISAPYFVWKEDQATIEALEQQLADPIRKSKAALVAAFAQDRAELVRRLLNILGDLRVRNDASEMGDETAAKLYQLASPFLIDHAFKTYWFTFEKNMKSFGALHRWREGKETTISLDDQRKLLVRYAFHHVLAEGAAESMVLNLSHEKDHSGPHERAKSQAREWYRGVDFTFALPPRARFNEIDWFTDGQEWNPPSPHGN